MKVDEEVREWCRLCMYGHITELELFNRLQERLTDIHDRVCDCGRPKIIASHCSVCDRDE